MKQPVILLAVVSAVLAGTPLWANAPLHVDDDGAQRPGAYPDIETALADAVVGDTILVHDGVYPGGINIYTDRVTLRAVGDAVLDAEITPPPPPPWGSAGLVVQHGVSGVTVQGFEMRGFDAGIVVGIASDDNVVKSNTVSDSAGVGIVVADTAAANSIVDNVVTHSGLGIVLDPASAANSVVGNVISLCDSGIVLDGIGMLYWSLDTTDDNLAKDNVVFGSALYDLFDDGTGSGNVWQDNQCNTANF